MSKAKISADPKSRTCVLILGMHRSGTSALAGVLSMLGCEVPAHQMVPSKNNAKGFFESTVVRDFNDELLASAGSSWDDFTSFHENWLKSPQGGEFLDRVVPILQGEFGDAQLFVLKDPRICRLVPFWTEALKRVGCTIRPILTVRNPLDVGHSLLSKRGLSEPLGQMMWLRHALDAERATRGMPRFHTTFEQLMRGWEMVVQGAEENLQLVWPKPIANVEFDVERFLATDLRHHKGSRNRALTSRLLPDWLRETYEILGAWAENGEAVADYPALDRIKSKFDTASNAFSRLVRAERDGSLEQKQRVQELEETNRAVQAELDRAVTQSRNNITALENSLEEQKVANRAEHEVLQAQLAKRSAEAEQQRAADQSEREALQTKLGRIAADAEQQRAAGEAERAALQSKLADLAADAEQQRALFQKSLEEQKASSDAQIEAVKATAEQDITELTRLLQDQRRQTTLLSAEVHQLKEDREALGAELQASRARRKEMARVIDRRNAEIQARYQELAALELHILHSSLWWQLQNMFRRIKRIVSRPFRRSVLS